MDGLLISAGRFGVGWDPLRDHCGSGAPLGHSGLMSVVARHLPDASQEFWKYPSETVGA
jgi:hypothetical protein